MINPTQAEYYIIKYIISYKPEYILFFDELNETHFEDNKLKILYNLLNEQSKRKEKFKLEIFIIEQNAAQLIEKINLLPEQNHTVRDLIDISKTLLLSKTVEEGFKIGSKNNISLEEKRTLLKDNLAKVDSISFKTELSSSKVSVEKYNSYLEEVIQMNKDSSNGIVGLPTGISALDQKINGIKKQDYIVVGARPSMGKTAMTIGMLIECIKDKNKIPVMFSLEMPAEQIVGRVIAQMNKSISLASTMYGENYKDNKTVIDDTLEYLEDQDFYIEDFIESNGQFKAKITPADLRKKLKEIRGEIQEKHKDQKNIGVIIVDYLQLLHPSYVRQGMSTNDIMGEISKEIKALIREFQCPVIALSQLSRDLEKRQDKRPQMSDLRDSGAIEQDADIIMFVYRSAVYLEKEIKEQLKTKPNDQDLQRQLNLILNQPVADAEVIIGKQRNGPLGTVHADFYKKCSMFGDVESFVGDIFEDDADTVYQPIYEMPLDEDPN